MDEDDELFFTGPRDYNEQTDAFRFELDSLILRYLEEFDINTITMIGAFQEKIEELVNSGNAEFEINDDDLTDEPFDEDPLL
tara:strand:+ start:184 stop:429 length:246 start_codon:yes stop_codon:yes gene_type:complete